MASIRFSDGLYGPLVPEADALRAFANIPEHRRALCRVTYWREVLPEDAETVPPPADFESVIDPLPYATALRALKARLPLSFPLCDCGLNIMTMTTCDGSIPEHRPECATRKPIASPRAAKEDG